MANEKLIICSDHAGFELKEYLKKKLNKDKIEFVDFGVMDTTSMDYPDIFSKAAKAISRGKFQKGIFICGSGVGADIVANRYKRVRAVLVYTKEVAKFSRLHNNANVIALGGRLIHFRKAYQLFKIWFNTKYSGEARHTRRIKKIDSLC